MLFSKDRPKLFRKLIAIVFLNMLFFSLLYLLFPGIRRFLVSENCCLETLTVVLYFATFILSLLFYVNFRKKPGAKFLLFASVAGLVGFLEEISYGQSLLHWKMPLVIGVEFDALHDLAEMGYKGFRYASRFAIGIAIIAGLAILAAVLLFRFRKYLFRGMRWIGERPHFAYILIGASFLCIGQMIDVGIFLKGNQHKALAEELLEMNAALALLFFPLSFRTNLSSDCPSGRGYGPNPSQS
jgi:hypothetical protein